MKDFAVVYKVDGFLYVKPFDRVESAEKEYNKIAMMGYSVGFMEYNKEEEVYEEIFYE